MAAVVIDWLLAVWDGKRQKHITGLGSIVRARNAGGRRRAGKRVERPGISRGDNE